MRNWLVVVYAMIAAMVLIGGITRLTGSGLSMVEWRPLMGALPPSSEAEWLAVFDKYKASPQYQQVNHWMTLADFQRIFFWEWFHRLFGRLIGVAFFVPWAWFALRKRLQGPWLRRTFVAFLLGGAQGLLGWFMVKSGLVDIPQVSHYRLAAHLSLAIFVGLYVAWLAFDLTWSGDEPKDPAGRRLLRWVWATLGLVAVQTVWGAFMAGSRAGYLFSTFPDMHGHYLPFALMADSPQALSFLDHPVAIHFVHRNLGYIAGLAGVALWAVGARRVSAPRARVGLHLAGAMVVLQVGLGIVTVVTGVNIVVAVLHQAGALALLTLLLWVAHALRRA